MLPAEPRERGDPLLEMQVSEYVIKERIGAGGMGIVYRAVQPMIGKQVAIKVLKAELAEAGELVKRLLVEARVVNSIEHRGVIDIFGFGQLPDGRPYVVMELLQGVPLDAFIRKRGRVGADETAEILDEMLAALGAAHREGVIHRDLKPGNVFLEEESDGARSVKLLDFGIAKVAQSQTIGALTMSGHILGTPEYMAPEQIRGEQVEPTADLYAVGVIAFQMLTGRRPFIGEQMQVLFAQVEEEPPRPSSLVPELPVELERIVLRLLAKRPAQRFQSAEAVRRELDAFLARRGEASRTETQGFTAEFVYPATVVLPTPPSIVGGTVPKQESAALPAPSKPIKRPLLVGTGAMVVVLAMGAVGLKMFHPESSAAKASAEAREESVAALSSPVPNPSQRLSETPKAVAPADASKDALAPPREESIQVEHSKSKDSPLPPALVPPRRVTVSKNSPVKPPSMQAPAPSPVQPVQASSPGIQVDHEALQERLADATVQLRKLDERAVTSPAMARLMAIQGVADLATTGEQRMKVAVMLDEWERKFLTKR
jgi:serine/threonine-protein kinase